MLFHFRRAYRKCLMAYIHVAVAAVPEKFRLVFCCLLISLFWCCFQYYILLLSGSLVVIHHSHNYPYHKGCCWHSQILYLSDFRTVNVEHKCSSLHFGCRGYPSLDPWKKKLLLLLVYWYVCWLLETKMQCDYFHKDSFGLWTVMYCFLHLLKVACEIDLDLALFIFNLLYVIFFSLLIHTIQHKVGIPHCGTLCISVWYSFKGIFSQYIFAVYSIQDCIHER